ncbi:MAG: hypothetical protein ACLTBV_21655 [Enterocloster bolteae]
MQNERQEQLLAILIRAEGLDDQQAAGMASLQVSDRTIRSDVEAINKHADPHAHRVQCASGIPCCARMPGQACPGVRDRAIRAEAFPRPRAPAVHT